MNDPKEGAMIQKTARLHESVVKDAEHYNRLYALSRPRTQEHRSRTSRMEITYAAHPLVWKQALELAGGDPSRLEVLDWTTIRVSN